MKPRNPFAKALGTPLYKQRRVLSDFHKKTHHAREDKKIHVEDCEHEWREIETMFNNEYVVVMCIMCIKCGMYGEKTIEPSDVYWPAA